MARKVAEMCVLLGPVAANVCTSCGRNSKGNNIPVPKSMKSIIRPDLGRGKGECGAASGMRWRDTTRGGVLLVGITYKRAVTVVAVALMGRAGFWGLTGVAEEGEATDVRLD